MFACDQDITDWLASWHREFQRHRDFFDSLLGSLKEYFYGAID
ncbi:226_t:CDS:1, partial [Acaulospora morrowiae]